MTPSTQPDPFIPRRWPVVLLVLPLTFFVVFCMIVTTRRSVNLDDPSYLKTPLSKGYVLVFRFNNMGVVEEAMISDTAVVTYKQRGHLPEAPIPTVQLDQQQWDAITNVRAQWCQQRTSPLRTVRPNEAFYDVALQCPNGLSHRLWRIPADGAPAIFDQLRDQVPTASAP